MTDITFDTLKRTEEKRLTKFHEIIDAVTHISDEAIQAKLQARMETPDLQSIIDGIEFEQDDIELTSYCNKTGQPCGNMSMDEFAELIKIHGKDHAKNLMSMRATMQYSVKWIKTDPEALDKLSEIDPWGYFVYAASNMLLLVQTIPSANNQMYISIQNDLRDKYKMDILQIKIKLYKHIKDKPIELIIQANELMRQYLAFCKTANAMKILVWHNPNLNQVAFSVDNLRVLISDIKNNIKNVLQHEYDNKRIKANLTYENIVRMQIKYEGHSNFRGQSRAKELTQTEQILIQLKDFMPDIKPAKMEVMVGKRGDRFKDTPKKGIIIMGKDLQSSSTSDTLLLKANLNQTINKGFNL